MNNTEVLGVVLLVIGLTLGLGMAIEDVKIYSAEPMPAPSYVSPFNTCLARTCFQINTYAGAECGFNSAAQNYNLAAVSAYCQNMTASGVGN
jgi:hypothetical protein